MLFVFIWTSIVILIYPLKFPWLCLTSSNKLNMLIMVFRLIENATVKIIQSILINSVVVLARRFKRLLIACLYGFLPLGSSKRGYGRISILLEFILHGCGLKILICRFGYITHQITFIRAFLIALSLEIDLLLVVTHHLILV